MLISNMQFETMNSNYRFLSGIRNFSFTEFSSGAKI